MKEKHRLKVFEFEARSPNSIHLDHDISAVVNMHCQPHGIAQRCRWHRLHEQSCRIQPLNERKSNNWPWTEDGNTNSRHDMLLPIDEGALPSRVIANKEDCDLFAGCQQRQAKAFRNLHQTWNQNYEKLLTSAGICNSSIKNPSLHVQKS